MRVYFYLVSIVICSWQISGQSDNVLSEGKFKCLEAGHPTDIVGSIWLTQFLLLNVKVSTNIAI